MVAGDEAAHGAADRVHDARAFVTVHRRIRADEIAIAAVQVGLAHAARHDADDHFVGARGAKFQCLDDERTRALAHYSGFDLHDQLLPAACICASTAAVGQQSSLSPLRFWYSPSAARVSIPALPSILS